MATLNAEQFQELSATTTTAATATSAPAPDTSSAKNDPAALDHVQIK